MTRILVSGLINIETTLKVDRIPVEYAPVRYPFFGVNSTVSGVGLNIAKALHTLGSQVDFLSLVGRDIAAEQVYAELDRIGMASDRVLPALERTAQSVILYEDGGRRMIFTDLKDIQDAAYPVQPFEQALAQADFAVLANINFSRPMLEKAAAANIPIATDVHAISAVEDDYNRDFMARADVLFMSHENLPYSPQEWSRRMKSAYRTPVVVVGMGERGALLAAGGPAVHVPAVRVRPIVNTIGAGDALFSAFTHFYAQGVAPLEALQLAVVFAAYKIGEVGAAEGFLPEDELRQLV